MVVDADSPLAVLRAVVPSLAGARILDVGCGAGVLARALVDEGSRVTGVDPNPEALAAARRLTPEARFELARAETLPFGDASFDAVVMLNALHHVPPSAMDAALDEAGRVLRPGAPLIVIEPLAEGSFFEAVRAVEDETLVRRLAQDALARAISAGRLGPRATVTFVRRETFDDTGRLLERVVAVDPSRAAAVARDLDRITTAVRAAAVLTEDGRLAFDQPTKADILDVTRAQSQRAPAQT